MLLLFVQPSKEKADSRSVSQTTSLKFFPAKEYSEHVESLNAFLQRLGYSYLIEVGTHCYNHYRLCTLVLWVYISSFLILYTCIVGLYW